MYKKIMQLVRIAIPSLYCKETAHIGALTLMLCIRTFLSIYLAAINGGIVKTIVDRDLSLFIKRVSQLTLVYIPHGVLDSSVNREFKSGVL